jgi:hypothetical protein
MRRACEMTMHGQQSKIALAKLAQCEHSPLRTVMYWVELQEIPTFVSVHLVRHKIGVEHFVKSMRDDLYIDPTTTVDRNTPVNHGMWINAHALITMMRKRLCYKSHRRTVAALRKLRAAVLLVDPELDKFLVPECVYRNNYCPELRECRPTMERVTSAYKRINTKEVD